MKRNKKKSSPVVMGAIVSLLLIIAIIGSIIYKYEVANRDGANDNDAVTGQVPTNVDEQEPPIDESVSNIEQPTVTPNEDEEIKEGNTVPTDVPKANANGNGTEGSKDKTNAPKENENVSIENGYIVGQQPAKEPKYVDNILIANKKYPLPATFNEGESATARAALDEMIAAAGQQGYTLIAFSGYRSYEYQTDLYNRYVNRDGKDAADRYSARPGYSEHQTGLTFDIGEKGKEALWLTSEFGETPAGKWLATNAHKYGFILRYPEGKEDVTGYMYESWHFRYLEGDTATKVYNAGVTLEEYLGIE
ncbi:M15 family metallopeptidase [Solibacillus cecembensis]|uniref:M15 family metallopeptidase n=1 Tax=Solibacillus cecembensis TaxID=459347 RepID=UPI003CFF4994